MEKVKEPELYQVFINHRGSDTKKKLASLLYHRLTSSGLNVFLDKDELCPGDHVYPAIKNAIRSASVHIAIFSKGYAESRPCLEELCWMLNSTHRRKIIPVFFDVKPSDLRDLDKQPYAKAFQEHQDKLGEDGTEVKEWKKALKESSVITGIEFQENTSDHGSILEGIVQLVWKTVDWGFLEVPKHQFGLHQAFEDLENKIIQKQKGTKVVGITGIGGIGKSALAKYYFNLRQKDFDRSCYLSHVRERKADLRSLQRQLVRALQKNEIEIEDTERGKTIVNRCVKGLKILIVLDDVDAREQITRLLQIDVVEPESLILVTCRDNYILKDGNPLVYDMKTLQRVHAERLFCCHAFYQPEPLEGYKDFVEVFLKICDGLPLCLILLGEHFADKLDREYWKQQLERFSEGKSLPVANDVINILKVSYESLESEEKDLFLDIGCFFMGEDIELAVGVSDGLDYLKDVRTNLLESLCQKHLVDLEIDAESQHEIETSGKDLNPQGNRHLIKPLCKFQGEYKYVESYLPPVLPPRGSKIRMQRQIRELARHIVREHIRPGAEQLRLSCLFDMKKMLNQDGSNSCRIRGILIPSGQHPPCLTNTITGVRFLVVEHQIDLSCLFGSAISSGNLVWLRLRNFDSISIPYTVSVSCLRVLEFQGPTDHLENLFNQLITRKHGIPTKLLELSIDAKGGASASTSSSRQLVDFQHSPESSDRNISSTHDSVMPSFHCFLGWIGTNLKDLKKIVLKNIPLLQSLPVDFSKLGNLMHLDLSGCTNLTKFRRLPIVFSNLTNLKHLDLSGATDLTKLPASFSQLLKLQYLALRDCRKLSIPTDILGKITTLEYIDFKGCAKLKHLPEGIQSQACLRYLNLLETRLRELPSNLQSLDKLEHLRIGSPRLKTLPVSVASLKGLKELIMIGCIKLHHIAPIEDLIFLERLDIYESQVKSISPPLKNVKVLTIYGSPISEFTFPSVMPALRDFTLSWTSISGVCIPSNVCPRLEEVDLSYSFKLEHVHSFPQTLVRLTLESCSKLKTLTDLSTLVHLRFLNLSGCTKLETLNVGGLTSLEEIRAERCWKLRSMEAFNQLERLNFLGISTDMDRGHFLMHTGFQDTGGSFEGLTVLDVSVKTTVKTPVILNNVLSHSAIFMCFLSHRASGNRFHVCFEPSVNNAESERYNTFCERSSQGAMLHMYMWTEDSKLFKDENLCTKVYGTGDGNELEEKGWIVTLPSKTPVLEVCNRIMFEGI